MNDWLIAILAWIADDTLLPATYYRRLDCNAALNSRDGDAEFASTWLRLYKEINQRWAEAVISPEVRSLAEDIRRESFLAVSRATRQHEIASYVSDDFALIVRGRLVGAEGGFLGALWGVYERGEFPLPPLQPDSES
jgi:hypothetical protein